MKKVLIVGGGVSGIFSALTIENAEVEIIEMGKDIEKRIEEIREKKPGFTKNFVSGIGGSGTFSDGKLNFHPDIGGELPSLVGKRRAEELIKKIEETFEEFGVSCRAEIKEEAENLRKEALKHGVKFIPIRQVHIGSDKLPEVVKKMREKLKENGVKISTEEKVTDIKQENGKFKVVTEKGREITADYVILAVGRVGSNWLKSTTVKIPYKHGPVDIGVRVEVPAEIMEEITEINYDPKFHIITPTYDDFVRTFCTNPNGFVIEEDYGDFKCVNGHAMKEKKSNNTNFAFLVRVTLTKPLEDTTEYGRNIAKLTTTLGGNKPIIQRLKDLKMGRRSTWGRLEKCYTDPTLKEVTPGDISMAFPARIVKDIVEGLEMLGKVIKGIDSEHTLLYAPEVKFYSLHVNIGKNMECKGIKNLFVVGDASGISRSIVIAAATGILAGEEICRRLSL